MLSFLRRNLKLNNQHLKQTAYFSLVRPQLEYTCAVWWLPWKRTEVKNLKKINFQAARFGPSHQQCIQHDWPTRMARLRNSKTKYPLINLLFKIIHEQTCISLTDITPPTILTSSTMASDLNNLPVPCICKNWHLQVLFWATCLHLPSYTEEVTLLET